MEPELPGCRGDGTLLALPPPHQPHRPAPAWGHGQWETLTSPNPFTYTQGSCGPERLADLFKAPQPHVSELSLVMGSCDSWACVAIFSGLCLSGVAKGVGGEMRGCFGKQLTPVGAWTAAG